MRRGLVLVFAIAAAATVLPSDRAPAQSDSAAIDGPVVREVPERVINIFEAHRRLPQRVQAAEARQAARQARRAQVARSYEIPRPPAESGVPPRPDTPEYPTYLQHLRKGPKVAQ